MNAGVAGERNSGAGSFSFADGHAGIRRWQYPMPPIAREHRNGSYPMVPNHPGVIWLLSRATARNPRFIPVRMQLRQPIKVAVKVCDQGCRLKARVQGDRFIVGDVEPIHDQAVGPTAANGPRLCRGPAAAMAARSKGGEVTAALYTEFFVLNRLAERTRRRRNSPEHR
jgi:prepilin-type processing-associated H-X9-DG protein